MKLLVMQYRVKRGKQQFRIFPWSSHRMLNFPGIKARSAFNGGAIHFCNSLTASAWGSRRILQTSNYNFGAKTPMSKNAIIMKFMKGFAARTMKCTTFWEVKPCKAVVVHRLS
jgi:hypothetical protein